MRCLSIVPLLSSLPPQFHHELFMCACINSCTQSSCERRLTGSCRGVQLHFLRRFSLLLIGPCRQASVPGDPPLPPSSRARAAASVARQQRSEVGTSSPAEEGGERDGWFVLCDWCIAPPLTRRRKICYAAAVDLFLERRSRALESADIYDISCVVYLIYTSVPA